jgi:prepilin-type N-terminal cleavage/methylation domain-containing protein
MMRHRGLTLLELLVVLTILVALATLVVPQLSYLGQGSQQIATRENLQRLQELLVNHYIPDLGGSVASTGSGVAANPAGNLPRPNMVVFPNGSRQDHPQLRYLFINPDTETPFPTPDANILTTRHWQGPYVTHQGARFGQVNSKSAGYLNGFTDVYGVADTASTDSSGNTIITSPGDPTVVDAWGNPIVIQVPTAVQPNDPAGTTGSSYARLVSAGPNGVIETDESVPMPTTAQRGDDVLMFLFVPDQYGPGLPKLQP